MNTPADQPSPITNLVGEISRYFRDFLESDFKKVRLPKRQIRLRGENRETLGINLRKYESFNRAIWQKFSEPLDPKAKIKITRGQYKAPIPPNLGTLINRQINGLADDVFQQFIDRLLAASALLCQRLEDIDEIIDGVEECISNISNELIAGPLVERLRNSLHETTVDVDELLYEISDDLHEQMYASVKESLAAAVSEILVEDDREPLRELITAEFSRESLQPRLVEFFSQISTSDLYLDLSQIFVALSTVEKVEMYLYVLDLRYRNHLYPVFYIPATIQRDQAAFCIEFDSRVFINKSALEYVSQEHAAETNRFTAGRLIDDRIVYFDEGDVRGAKLQEITDRLVDKFELPQPIDMLGRPYQKSQSPSIRMTSSLHLCVFDKGDEALLNDYESILRGVDEGDDLSTLFTDIVERFVTSDPSNVRSEVDREWNETPSEEKLVFRCPLPLNSEQRKVVAALKKADCRYLTVQGPPGTGKSHTIVALVFDAIMNGQSTLVLSDKVEALDVVEKNLSNAINKVRLSEDFRNPILRLGKAGSSYSAILKGSTIEKIKTYQGAFESKKAEMERSLKDEEAELRENLRKTIEAYESIDIGSLIALEELESELRIEEDQGRSIEVESESISLVNELIGYQDKVSSGKIKISAARKLFEDSGVVPSPSAAIKFCDSQIVINEIAAKYSGQLHNVGLFEDFELSQVDTLKQFIDEFESLKMPVFGFLFRRASVDSVSKKFHQTFRAPSLSEPHRRLSSVKSAYKLVSVVRGLTQLSDDRSSSFTEIVDKLRTGQYVEGFPWGDVRKILVKLDGLVKTQPELQTVFAAKCSLTDLVFSPPERIKEYLSRVAEYLALLSRVGSAFRRIPSTDYFNAKQRLETLCAANLANVMDERLIDFVEQKATLSKALRQVISKKQKFPRESFEELKSAFPCMIAGIRDYAQYIPLEKGIIDLVIIDEASQVSIAQAFPALLRAKKIIVLGDANQFSNVKTANASKATNAAYTSKLVEVFKENFDFNNQSLERIKKFNIKTSVLDFFGMVSNYNVMLKKHFRSYPELISFSSKHFYDGELQPLKIRAKPIDQVIEFSELESDGLFSPRANTNDLEEKFISQELGARLDRGDHQSVGVITPHREQQKYLAARLLGEHPKADKFREILKLKIMTFDSCQGEERDVIYYSMVATEEDDKLNYIFPVDLENTAERVEEMLKMQRLNVGFSRAKEKIHFVLSKPIEKYRGTAIKVLNHYQDQLEAAAQMPSAEDVDPNSPMEVKVLQWIQATAFYQLNSQRLEVKAQFPVGEYLKQLDPFYKHPAYRCDFFITYKGDEGALSFIIEYDGFREHFSGPADDINEYSYQHYYKAEDVERQKILESYGYRFLRINRFNLGKDPVSTLSARMEEIVKKKPDLTLNY